MSLLRYFQSGLMHNNGHETTRWIERRSIAQVSIMSDHCGVIVDASHRDSNPLNREDVFRIMITGGRRGSYYAPDHALVVKVNSAGVVQVHHPLVTGVIDKKTNQFMIGEFVLPEGLVGPHGQI